MKKYLLLLITVLFSAATFSQTFNGTGGPISDNSCDATHDFPVTVSGVGVLGTAFFFNDIQFDITHTYDGDLSIYLVAPNGTIVAISTNNGGSGNNYTNTIISFNAATLITSGTPPFTGNYYPEGNLGVLNGINADGVWILRICDGAGTDVGTLNNWSISFGSANTPDYANIEAPFTATINQSGSLMVYGRVYEAGLTDVTTGQAPGIQAWVGYSATNTNPNTWTNWVPATFNQKVTDTDEYKASIGSSLLPGTYYYATRFKLSSGLYYSYGGINNGIWDTGNHGSGVLTVGPALPATNDNCSGAIALTINPDYGCGVVTSGTVLGATASPVDGNACGGSEDDDVWFSFVATATTHRIKLANVIGSATDIFHSLWTGADCNSLSLVPGSCSDADTSNPTGLIIGQTYYVRVYTVTPNPSQTTTFNICVGSLPAPPNYVSLQSPATVSIEPGGSFTAFGQIYKAGITDVATGQAPGIQAWVGISPINNNSNPNTWTNWTPATFNQEVGVNDEYKAVIGSTSPGTYYYATRFQQTGGNYYYGGIDDSNNGSFWDGTVYVSGVLTVNSPNAPPNDQCIGAIPLTMGNVFTDFPVTGTTYGATDGASYNINCDGINTVVNSAVFYSVTIPAEGSLTVEIKAATSNSLINTVLVTSVGSCSSLIGMACNNNNGSSLFSKVTMFGQSPGSTLYIAVYKQGTAMPSLTQNQFQISVYTASLGSDSFDSSNFRYYPNPITDILNLSYNQEISNVEVFNLLGQKMISKTLHATEGSIDFSSLSKGIYLVNVSSGNQIKTIKIIKE